MEKLKEHEVLGKLDELFEQLEPAARERALVWLRAKHPPAAVVRAPLVLAPPLDPLPWVPGDQIGTLTPFPAA